MKVLPYSIVNDGSNDNSVKQMNTTCALIFYVNRCKTVDFRFFDMCTATGEHRFTDQILLDVVKQTLK